MLDDAKFLASDIMTRDVAVVHPETTLLAAVKLMASAAAHMARCMKAALFTTSLTLEDAIDYRPDSHTADRVEKSPGRGWRPFER